jgi:phosphatidylserine/phosphatidylglycerophosphate/cardiolipin synthase-like enzyme
LIDCRAYYRAFYQAATAAQQYILIAGWQFDSLVALLRGPDVQDGVQEVRFLPLLNQLCKRNPHLHVYILAWDFALLFLWEREWWQRQVFNDTTCDRLEFRFDNRHPIGASHHQKFVVVDGQIAFVGGADICEDRWDDCDHRAYHPDRLHQGNRPHGPYHEIQGYCTGSAAEQLTELFRWRWLRAGGSELLLRPPARLPAVRIDPTVSLGSTSVALSRTHPAPPSEQGKTVAEIRQLYITAIMSAQRLIYLENQYFSSQVIHDAFVDRMRETRRPHLQIVIILPKRAEKIIEDLALGGGQSTLLRSLQQVARQTGHALGIYYTTATDDEGRERTTYIHSKLLLIDDRFLSVGSANTTNRSLGFDSELNLSWEVTAWQQRALARAIRTVRVSLLAEHTGLSGSLAWSTLCRSRQLVGVLNRLANSRQFRLRHHPLRTVFDESQWLRWWKPQTPLFDPARTLTVHDVWPSVLGDER